MSRTFSKGGIHPNDSKISENAAIEQFPLPETGYVSMAQHLGAPAEPVVSPGDTVKVGQLLGKPSGFISAAVHSPFSGTVKSVEPYADLAGNKVMTVAIEVNGDEWLDTIDRTDTIVREIPYSSSEIVARIAECGIVGLGGATFPTNVKLSPPPGKKAEYLIINGAECEPFLTSDYRLMLEMPEQLLVGTRIMMKALGLEKAYIGIEDNKPAAISKLGEFRDQYRDIEIVPLKKKYPQGGIVTITGRCLPQQHNFRLRAGTMISSILEAVGGIPDECMKIISGGPMMGKAVSNLSAATLKGTSSLLLMTEKETKRTEESNCIRCGKCVSACPMGLEPYLLNKLGRRGMTDELEQEHVYDCIECGCCSYTCPANIPLLDVIRNSKAAVMKIMRSRPKK